MADSTIAGLTSADSMAKDDVIPFTDISDTAEEPTGKTKKITRENLFASGNSCATGGAIKIQDTFTCTTNSEQCIHGHRPIVGNYIYFGTESFRTSIAKLWKVNLDDFSDVSSITFPVDANHVGVSDVLYSKNNDKLYVAFRDTGYIAEVDPYTFAGYADVITNGTNLAGCAIWIEGDYLYQIGQTNPTKLYKYNLTNYSLSASNLTIYPANGHGLITNGDYLYAVTGAFAQVVTVWKFNKSDLSQVTIKIYSDMQGGSHDIIAVNNEYLFFGLHGSFINVGIGGFVRIDINNFNYYDHVITLPSDLVGPVIGCAYHNNYVWLTQLGRPGALIRVDPDSLDKEIYRFPSGYSDFLGDYYYAQGPVVFDDKGRAYSSFMPDFWEDELNVPAYLSRYTFSDFHRPYDTQDIVVKKDINPYISVINTANLVTTHDVTVDVDNGASKGTITASAGTPYSAMYAGQVFELSETPDNDEVYTIDSVTDTVITTTAVISGSDYSGDCAVRARHSNRVFMQAFDDFVTLGGYNATRPENAVLRIRSGGVDIPALIVQSYTTGADCSAAIRFRKGNIGYAAISVGYNEDLEAWAWDGAAWQERMRILHDSGYFGINTDDPKSMLHVVGLPVYANNGAALAGGLTAGAFYRTGGDPDPVCVVH